MTFFFSFLFYRSKIGSEEVTVTVTPNGYADAVCGNRFVMPEERRMTFGSFLDVIERKYNPRGVFYVQKQNSNFTDEFQSLMSDAPADIPWASEALGEYMAFFPSFNLLYLSWLSDFQTFLISNFHCLTPLTGKKPDAVNFWIGDERAVTSSKQTFCLSQKSKNIRNSAQRPLRELVLCDSWPEDFHHAPSHRPAFHPIWY